MPHQVFVFHVKKFLWYDATHEGSLMLRQTHLGTPLHHCDNAKRIHEPVTYASVYCQVWLTVVGRGSWVVGRGSWTVGVN